MFIKFPCELKRFGEIEGGSIFITPTRCDVLWLKVKEHPSDISGVKCIACSLDGNEVLYDFNLNVDNDVLWFPNANITLV